MNSKRNITTTGTLTLIRLNPSPNQLKKTQKNYEVILQEYEQTHKTSISPVNCKSPELVVPKEVTCPHCNAPHQYVYFNNGKKRTQLKCKVCGLTFQLYKPLRNLKAKYYCPHCGHALFRLKHNFLVTTYKCSDDNCPYRIKRLNQLKPSEKMLQKMKPSQFKINYQYREYHLKHIQIQHAAPAKPTGNIVDIFKIRKPDNLPGLVLDFYISFALSARKTALIIRWVFGETC
jgi:putative transposase